MGCASHCLLAVVATLQIRKVAIPRVLGVASAPREVSVHRVPLLRASVVALRLPVRLLWAAVAVLGLPARLLRAEAAGAVEAATTGPVVEWTRAVPA